MRKLTSTEITNGFRAIRHKYRYGYPLNIQQPKKVDYDLVRIAYHWLDAQVVDNSNSTYTPRYDVKDRICNWCGLQISAFYIILAADMHPDIKGEYPAFNLSSTIVNPSLSRLDGLSNIPTTQKVFKFKK